ncbi:MAG: hypothetical protein ABIR17_08310 [Pseudolysinimonas sp.]|uniref:hypothetical protein n=1 Tax=Pseudolysinimonas sp. TaxID=2680009 RepID=UPI003264E774
MSSRGSSGPGRVLVAVYAVLAIGASGRSVFQIVDRFREAPVAFTLSALAAVIYIVATLALALSMRRNGMNQQSWDRVAWVTIGFELVGVLVVGTLSVVSPGVLGLQSVDPFGRQATVWSLYGAGYLGIPLVLPILGLFWLDRRRRESAA